MNTLKHTAIALVGTLLLGGQAIAAPVLNIDLNNWQTLGDASVQAGVLTLTNALDEGDDNGSNFNLSGLAPAEANVALTGVEAFAGLSVGALDIDPGQQALEGSAARHSLWVDAGDTLSFDWNFLTNEGGQADQAFVAVNGAVVTLAQALASTTTQPGLLGYAAQTGWGSFSHTFTASGSFTVAMGVVDTAGFDTSSALQVRNLAVTTAVPEPESYALALLGLGLLGLGARRFK